MSNINITPFYSKGYENVNLEVKGTQEFLGKEIPVIYGGFGSNQKVVSAKTVAEIHGMEVKHVNELINNNIKRFKEGIDIIDVINDDNFKVVVNDLGLKGSNRTKNIYLLSERGYAKLIKIMDSDLAWEIHDQLMDEYFSMREERINPYANLSPELQMLIKLEQGQTVLNQRVDEQKQDFVEFKQEFQNFKEEQYIAQAQCKQISNRVKSLGTKLLGGKKSPAYQDKSLRAQVYSDIYSQVHREFGVKSCADIKCKDYSAVFSVIHNYSLPMHLLNDIEYANNQMSLAV